MSEETLGTKTIVHVAVIVGDVETKLQAWADLLDIPAPKAVITDTVELAHTEYHGERSPARAKIARFRLGAVAVELIEPIDGPSTWGDHLDQHGDGLEHVALLVEGLDDKMAFLEANGIPLVQSGDFTGGRYIYSDGRKTLGAMLELTEHTD